MKKKTKPPPKIRPPAKKPKAKKKPKPSESDQLRKIWDEDLCE